MVAQQTLKTALRCTGCLQHLRSSRLAVVGLQAARQQQALPSAAVPHSRQGDHQCRRLLQTCCSAAVEQDAGGAEAAPAAAALDVDRMDIRIGKVLKAELHPDADSLYVEQVEVGEEEPRTIISGLVKFVPLEQMQDRPVIVLCNLKARNMRGIKSHGMLLCASNATHDQVEPLTPPEGAQVGERVFFGPGGPAGQPEAETPNKVQKKKIWEEVQPELRTNERRQAAYQGHVMMTSQGPVTATTLSNSRIS